MSEAALPHLFHLSTARKAAKKWQSAAPTITPLSRSFLTSVGRLQEIGVMAEATLMPLPHADKHQSPLPRYLHWKPACCSRWDPRMKINCRDSSFLLLGGRQWRPVITLPCERGHRSTKVPGRLAPAPKKPVPWGKFDHFDPKHENLDLI